MHLVGDLFELKLIQHVRRMDRKRKTATRNYKISTTWVTKPRTIPQKTSRLLVGTEQVTRAKILQSVRLGRR